MTPAALEWTVQRTLPTDTLQGILSGAYQMYGGVIRRAPGTPGGGQIVRHLIFPAGAQLTDALIPSPVGGLLNVANYYQLRQLSGQMMGLQMATQQVLALASSTMLLSGLNLAVSAVGFAVIVHKLNKLEGKLQELQKEVQAIRNLLELKERSELKAALRDLLNIVDISNPDHRHTMLFNSKNVLAPINFKYKELLAEADIPEVAMAYEEYFCLTALAHARCVAELGMLQMARRDLLETKDFWQAQARRIATDLLLGEHPERFLFSDFAQEVPVTILAGWLDFAYGEEKGYAWVDELRSKTKSWYPPEKSDKPSGKEGWNLSLPKAATPSFAPLSRAIGRSAPQQSVLTLSTERETIIPAFGKLVARNEVMGGYEAQYELFEEFDITPSAFEKQVQRLPAEQAVEGFYILELPVKQPE